MNVLLLKAWLREEGPQLIGMRLRAVRQHDDRSLLIDLAGEEGPRTLLLSVLEEFPLLALVADEAALPPGGAPEGNFAKALNFHLAGYQLDSIAQEGFDRSVLFTFSQRDTYGRETGKVLRHELAGRAANAFLISDRGMVVSIMKRVRRGRSRVRHVVTGKPLPEPPPLGKFIAAGGGVDELAGELAAPAERAGVAGEDSIERFFTQRVAAGDVKLWPALEPLLPVQYDLGALYDFIYQLQRGELTARLFGLKTRGDANRVALELWMEARRKRGVRRSKPDLARERIAVRLDQLLEQRALSGRADEVEQLALEMLCQAAEVDEGGQGAGFLREWQARYADWAEQVTPEKSVYDNAQELVRYAQRLRRGREKVAQLIGESQAELTRLERAPVASAQREAPPPDPVAGQRERLTKHGVKYLRFVSSDGLHILCGLNELSNDGLLRVFGSGRHLWLHARDFGGSHVLVLSAGRDVPPATLLEAALVAAYYSRGRKEAEVEVSYLPLKHLRRPKGGKPGQVLKMEEKVIAVRPERFEAVKDRLRYTAPVD